MASAIQRARARNDLENGKRIVLHTTKLSIKQRQRLGELRIDLTMQLQTQISNDLYGTHHVTMYANRDEAQHFLYMKRGNESNMLAIDYSKQTMTLYYADGRVTVARTIDEMNALIAAL